MVSRRQLLAGVSLAGVAACKRYQASPFPRVAGTTSAERAVNAARRFAGITLNCGWETGMQAHDLRQWSGPLWEKLTGIRINVVELGSPIEAYRRVHAEHQAGNGTLDCAMLAPAWMPDLLLIGALEPLDAYVEHYMLPGDLDDLLPLYRDLGKWNGRRYGLFDDGDVLLLYYRRDLFADPALQKEFAARFGHPLGSPVRYDWQQFADAARFFTEKLGPDGFGLAPFNRDLRWGWFQGLLRKNGGQFFEPATMRPGVDAPPALLTMTQLAELERFMPPGVSDVGVGAKEAMLSTYASGGSAMAVFWPPLGRWTEGYGLSAEEQGGARTKVAGKTGYALLPGGVAQLALGFLLCLFERSRQKEAAYLFMQWLNSPDISLERVMLPGALRDPFRISHISSPKYRARWAAAAEYLETLGAAATKGAMLDLLLPGHADYAEAFFAAFAEVRKGTALPAVMQQMAARWDAVTERYGREAQRAAYQEYLKKPGALMVR